MAEFKEFQVQSEYLYEQEVLNAHKKSITYLKYKDWEAADGISEEKKAVLITGSEDQTVRIWNMNTKKSLKCFLGFFSQSIDSLDFHPFNPFIIYCASGNQIFSLNSQSENVIERNPYALFQYDEIEGDINSMVVHPKKLLLAFSDDSYSIYLVPITDDGNFAPPSLQGGKYYKSLRRVHSNIVYSLLFTENARKEEFYSGGFDFCLCFWDTERGRPNKSLTIQMNSEMKNDTQTLNPPFVYNLQLMNQGKLLVVALGDGSVRMFVFLRFVLQRNEFEFLILFADF
jgi:WD40 repeat protein